MSARNYIPTPEIAHCEQFNSELESCQNCNNDGMDMVQATLFQECVAFYDVFLNLESRLSNSGIRDSFDIEARNPRLLSVPYNVNGAFACELALKYLLIESNIPFDMRTGHSLEYLFNLLPNSPKRVLVEKLKECESLSDEALQINIRLLSNTFNEWRYLFESISTNHSVTSFFKLFVHGICDYVLTR